MPLKVHGPGSDVTVVRAWNHGLSWMAHPDERMRRASHALVTGDEVWLVDPLDANGLDERIAGLGEVAGVVVLTNSHGRHADRLAQRHGVPIHVPACFDENAHPVATFDASVETFDDELADTGFELVWEKDGKGWMEGALYHPDRRTLVVPDALMTSLFARREGRLEVFPPFQFSPPRAALGRLTVDRVLVGHGEPVFEDAGAALAAAFEASSVGAATAVARSVPTFARIALQEIRS